MPDMDLHHPWRDLRHREHITVYWTALPPSMSGVTDGRHIWLDRDLLQVERRCILTHEVIHIDMGDATEQPPHVERSVRRATARQLLSVERVARVAQWTLDLHEAADELWVTPRVLTDYIDSLTPDEHAHIEDAVRRRDG